MDSRSIVSSGESSSQTPDSETEHFLDNISLNSYDEHSYGRPINTPYHRTYVSLHSSTQEYSEFVTGPPLYPNNEPDPRRARSVRSRSVPAGHNSPTGHTLAEKESGSNESISKAYWF